MEARFQGPVFDDSDRREAEQRSVYERLRLKLKATRLEAGLTQAEAARMLGRPRSFISKVEMGSRRVDFMELQVLAKIYNKSPSYFYDPSVTAVMPRPL